MRIAILFSLLSIVLLASCSEKTTPNGYAYETLAKGDGAKANPTDYAFVHIYVMYDDSLVNSTRNQGQLMPIVVPDFANLKPEDMANGKPNPIQDLLAVMSVGDSVSVAVPIDDEMKQQNPSLATVNKLSYDVVLHEVKTAAEFLEAQEAEKKKMMESKMSTQMNATGPEGEAAELVKGYVDQYAAGELDGKLQTTASGLKYLILEPGKGKQAAAGQNVEVNYYGALTNGLMFDNSFGRGKSFPFPLGQGRVIKGWDEGIALLKPGAKAMLFIPSDLAYGPRENGSIPANSELIFYVELISAK